MTQQFNRQGVASTLIGDLGFNDFLEAPVLEMESALEPAAGQLEKLVGKYILAGFHYRLALRCPGSEMILKVRRKLRPSAVLHPSREVMTHQGGKSF